MDINLYDKTLSLLKSTELSVDIIGSAVGRSGRWVRKVKNGQIPDPGIKKIQALHDFLSTRITE